jgi:alkylated DNA repair dioxygenase AlkB
MAWTRDKPACSKIRRQGPPGFVYRSDLIDPDEEATLAERLARLNLRAFEMQGYVARRRVAYFGRRYDGLRAGTGGRTADPGLPAAAAPQGGGDLAGLTPDDLVHALVNEYPPGAPIGWHRDKARVRPGGRLLAAVAVRPAVQATGAWPAGTGDP